MLHPRTLMMNLRSGLMRPNRVNGPSRTTMHIVKLMRCTQDKKRTGNICNTQQRHTNKEASTTQSRLNEIRTNE